MNKFLSDDSIALHMEFVRKQRLKLSVIEAEFPSVMGLDPHLIARLRIPRDVKINAIDLSSEVKLHDVFFTSFSPSRFVRSRTVETLYGSEAAFLNRIYREALSLRFGFVTVHMHLDNIYVRAYGDPKEAFSIGSPILAFDVCEHTYFSDYGFDKERFLLSAIPYLDISKLTV